MLRNSGPGYRLLLARTLPITAMIAVAVATAQPSQAQTASPFCVSADPRANSGQADGFTVASNCQQFFANGATFPGLFYRRFMDYYGIGIPSDTSGQTGGTGTQTTTPFGSPRVPSFQYNYCLTGSGNGRAAYTGTGPTSSTCSYTASFSGAIITPNNPGVSGPAAFPTTVVGTDPLFNGSDVPLSSTDLTNYATNRLATRGNPIQIPTVFGAVAIAYNPGLTTTLNLTTQDLCSIFDSTYTDYSQLQGTTGLAGPINVIIRSDSSGTTNIFTTYLAAACGAGYYLTEGVNTFPAVTQTARFVRAPGNDGVSNAVSATPGAIGYTESSFTFPFSAESPAGDEAPRAALLQNPVSGTFVAPVVSTTRASLSTVALAADPTYPCVLTVSGVPVVPTDGNAYPIVGTTYALAYSSYPTTIERDAVSGLLLNMLGNAPFGSVAANDQIAQSFGFVALTTGSSVVETNTIRATARACVSTITSPAAAVPPVSTVTPPFVGVPSRTPTRTR